MWSVQIVFLLVFEKKKRKEENRVGIGILYLNLSKTGIFNSSSSVENPNLFIP